LKKSKNRLKNALCKNYRTSSLGRAKERPVPFAAIKKPAKNTQTTEKGRAVDPDSLNTDQDPAFQATTDLDPDPMF